MKIIQLIDTLRTGGSERMCVNIANTLSEAGIANGIIATHSAGELASKLNEKTYFHVLHKKRGTDIRAFFRLYKLIQSFRPDNLHAHSTSIYWACLLKIIFPSTRLIWHDHYGLSDYLKPYHRLEMKLCALFIDAIIPVNQKLEQWARQSLSVSPANVRLLHNFPVFRHTIHQEQREQGHLLHLANFRPQKDHLTLLRALLVLKNQNVSFTCSLVGAIGDRAYYDLCMNFINEHALAPFTTVHTQTTDIESFLSKASIGVLSSSSEGLPVSLLEYGLAGLPVVCTDTGECATVLNNEQNGWIVPAQNAEELADRLLFVLNNPDIAEVKSTALATYIQDNYSAAAFLNQYKQLAQRLF